MILKKIDKKKDRILIHSHKLKLLDQLQLTTDPALVFHVAILIIFTVATQNMIHASGRHVSALLAFLKPNLNDEQWKILSDYHDLVLKVLAGAEQAENDEGKENLNKLNEMIPIIKEIAKNYKKLGGTGGGTE